MIKSKKQMFLVIGAFALVMLLGTATYAFFNYTRTGASNSVSTGSIYFLSEQTGSISVSNFFPTDSASATHGNNSSQMTIAITAGTSYEYGIDYSLTAVNVTRPSGSTTNIPVKVVTSTSDSAIGYTPEAVATITSTSNVLLGTGHIEPATSGGLTGHRVTGTITVTAYIDAQTVAITDTATREGNTVTGESAEWVNGRTIVTTEEWNRLAETPITFAVKVVADEGAEPAPSVPTIACPGEGCKFMYPTNLNNKYYYSASNNAGQPLSTTATFTTNGDTLVDDYTTLNKDSFLGFKFDGSGNVTNAYACGINANNNNAAFCLEAALSDTYGGNSTTRASAFTANVGVLNTAFPSCNATDTGSNADCIGSINGSAYASGRVDVAGGDGRCSVNYNGYATCY